MKTTYRDIPALPFAADADVEALRRQLEGGSLEANEDGTVSTKDSKVTKPTIAQSKANANKKKLGDVPSGVLGAESLRDILARAEEAEETPANTAQPVQNAEKSKEQKKAMGNVPSGVLGADSSNENPVSPEVAAMINEFRSDEEASTPAKANKDAKKLGDVPGGVLGMPSA